MVTKELKNSWSNKGIQRTRYISLGRNRKEQRQHMGRSNVKRKNKVMIIIANVSRLWIKPKKKYKRKYKNNRSKRGRGKNKTKDNKNEEVLIWIYENKFDIFGMSKPGLNWNKLPKSRTLKEHIKN